MRNLIIRTCPLLTLYGCKAHASGANRCCITRLTKDLERTQGALFPCKTKNYLLALKGLKQPRMERIQRMGASKGYLSRPFVEFVPFVAVSNLAKSATDM